MFRTVAKAGAFALVLLLTHTNANAQSVVITVDGATQNPNYFAAQGYYGTTYGTASYKVPRLYSNFPSAGNGQGYGLGLDPYGFVPNQYGLGMWRPVQVSKPGSGASEYGTFTIMKGPGVVLPPFGYYAPAYGPGAITIPR